MSTIVLYNFSLKSTATIKLFIICHLSGWSARGPCKGEGLAGAFLRNEELAKELSEALLEFKKLSSELEALVKDIKGHPKKYLKFSIF